MLHIPPINYHFPAAKEEPYEKAYLLTKNIKEFSREKSGERASRQKEKKDKKSKGSGRRPREAIVKWNQVTALRFQTGGRH